jgi:hypothetical protein
MVASFHVSRYGTQVREGNFQGVYHLKKSKGQENAPAGSGARSPISQNWHQKTFIPSDSSGKLQPLTRLGLDDNKQGCVQTNAATAANRSLSAKWPCDRKSVRDVIATAQKNYAFENERLTNPRWKATVESKMHQTEQQRPTTTMPRRVRDPSTWRNGIITPSNK